MLVCFIVILTCTTCSANAWPTKIRQERLEANVCKSIEFENDDICEPSVADQGRHDVHKIATPRRCQCDLNCVQHDDCCVDAKQLEQKSNSVPTSGLRISSCRQLPPYRLTAVTVSTVTSCPDSWQGDNKIVQLCRNEATTKGVTFLQHLPVYSNATHNLYSNYFCAICNHDAFNLIQLNVTFHCERDDGIKVTGLTPPLNSYVLEMYQFIWQDEFNRTIKCSAHVQEYLDWSKAFSSIRLRTCYDAIGTCPDGYQDEATKAKCTGYTSYVFIDTTSERTFDDEFVDDEEEKDEDDRPSYQTYKNYHCALCHGIRPSRMTCFPSGRSNDLPELPAVSLSLLFDFNLASGELVAGDSKSCSIEDGLVYDPREQKCIELFCGRMYEFDNQTGQCVRKYTSAQRNGNELDSQCLKIMFERYEFIYHPNRTVYVMKYDTVLEPSKYEVHQQEVHENVPKSILVCLEETSLQIPFAFSINERLLTITTLFVSTICLILHLIPFLAIPDLRNTPGKILMSLSSSLLMANVSFLVGSYHRPEDSYNVLKNSRGSLSCVLAGILIHYSYLVSFCWMNVMAFDCFRTFSASKGQRRSASSRRHSFLRYSLYSWLLPAFLVLMCCALDIGLKDSLYQPLYGFRVCWLSQRRAVMVYFALPVAILLAVNLLFFSLTARSIWSTRKQTRSVRKESDKCRFVMYVKLATVMGLTWVFGFLASVLGYKVLWYPFIFFNGLQGAIIFFAFTVKRKVLRLARQRIGHFIGDDVSSSVPAVKKQDEHGTGSDTVTNTNQPLLSASSSAVTKSSLM